MFWIKLKLRIGVNKKMRNKWWLLLILACLWISGCGKSELSEEHAERIIREEFVTLLDYKEDESNSLIKSLYEGFVVEIQEVKKDGKKYIVTCKISNYEVGDALKELEEKEDKITKENYEQMIEQIMEKTEKISWETTFVVTKQGKSFEIQFTEEQFDVAMGGFLSYCRELEERMK